MQFSTFSVIAALAAGIFAQSLADIPTCAYGCVGSGSSGTGCGSTDIACLCKSSSWVADLSCCVSTACDAADQETVATLAQQECASAGVSNVPTKATCAASSTAAAATTSTAAGVAATASSVVTSVASLVSSAANPALTATSNAASSNAAPAPTHALGRGMGIAAAAGLFAAVL